MVMFPVILPPGAGLPRGRTKLARAGEALLATTVAVACSLFFPAMVFAMWSGPEGRGSHGAEAVAVVGLGLLAVAVLCMAWAFVVTLWLDVGRD